MNRNQRRRAKVVTSKLMPVAEIKGARCAWGDCMASFSGDMPKGWVFLLTYWSKRPILDFSDPNQPTMRDAVLCPEHVQALESQLKDLASALLGPAAGAA
jgi:hypothetical protein